MHVSQSILAQLRAHAAATYPLECCGLLLLGEHNHITAAQPAANVHPAPHSHFEIDPAALIAAHRAARAGGPQVVGYYHSHPHGPPDPSATDQAEAAGDGRIWAIIGVGTGAGIGAGTGAGEIRFWRDTASGFERLSCAPHSS